MMPPHRQWRAGNVLSSVRAVRARPAAAVHTAGRSLETQCRMYKWMVERDGPRFLQERLRRRLSTMLGVWSVLGESTLCVARLRITLDAVPFFIGLATLRRIGNAWSMSRCMGGGATPCRFGCMA